MAAYLIVDTKIHDAEAYEHYKALARPIAESFGAEYLVRGGELDVVDEQLWSPTRIAVLRFPNTAAAHAFLDSEDYAPVKAIRHQSAESTVVVVAGTEEG